MRSDRAHRAAPVDRRQRRFLVILTILSLVAAVAQAISGVPELVLYLTPLFLMAALLLSGHYVAEERIVERWRGAPCAPRGRRARARVRLERERPLASLLERSSVSRRGPPALRPLAF